MRPTNPCMSMPSEGLMLLGSAFMEYLCIYGHGANLVQPWANRPETPQTNQPSTRNLIYRLGNEDETIASEEQVIHKVRNGQKNAKSC